MNKQKAQQQSPSLLSCRLQTSKQTAKLQLWLLKPIVSTHSVLHVDAGPKSNASADTGKCIWWLQLWAGYNIPSFAAGFSPGDLQGQMGLVRVSWKQHRPGL